MPSIKINATDLRAVALFSAKQDCRWYLNGVCVEVLKHQVRLIATNGHIMAVAYQVRDDDTIAIHDTQLIIPSAAVAVFAKEKGDLILDVPAGVSTCTLKNLGGLEFVFTPVDGKFPDYRRVLPSSFSGQTAQFNGEYIALFDKAAKKIYGRKFSPSIAHNGDGSAMVRGVNENFIGIIMPVRNTVETTLPEWYEEKREEEQVAA
jgi:DNA polymerase-3 subunit beta